MFLHQEVDSQLADNLAYLKIKKSEETGQKKKTKEEADALKRREMQQASVVV